MFLNKDVNAVQLGVQNFKNEKIRVFNLLCTFRLVARGHIIYIYMYI